MRERCAWNASHARAEHLNKGIFFAKHLHVARSAVAHRYASKMRKRSATDRFGIHEPPTTGSPIRHRTTRFAQKLRKLFPPASDVSDARNAPDGDVEACDRVRAVAFRMPKPTPAVDGNSTREMPSPEPGYTSRACMSLRITPARKRKCGCLRINDDAGAERSGRHRVLRLLTAPEPNGSGGADQWSSSSSSSA
jgi:hypothetical protein